MYLSLEISDFDQFNIDVNKDEMNDFKKRNDALFDGLGTWILAWSAPIQWICAILLFIAIFHIAARKYSGWWLALIAVTTLAAIDIPMQIIRLTMTSSTALDYSYGLPMIIGLLFTLLFPKFKTALRNEHVAETI